MQRFATLPVNLVPGHLRITQNVKTVPAIITKTMLMMRFHFFTMRAFIFLAATLLVFNGSASCVHLPSQHGLKKFLNSPATIFIFPPPIHRPETNEFGQSEHLSTAQLFPLICFQTIFMFLILGAIKPLSRQFAKTFVHFSSNGSGIFFLTTSQSACVFW